MQVPWLFPPLISLNPACFICHLIYTCFFFLSLSSHFHLSVKPFLHYSLTDSFLYTTTPVPQNQQNASLQRHPEEGRSSRGTRKGQAAGQSQRRHHPARVQPHQGLHRAIPR